MNQWGLVDGNYLVCRAVFKGLNLGLKITPEMKEQYSSFENFLVPANKIMEDDQLAKDLSLESGDFFLPTGGIYLFLRSLFALNSFGKLVVIFDGGHSKFRTSLLPDYKKRPKKDENSPQEFLIKTCFDVSFTLLDGLLTRMGIPNFRISGAEADDVLYLTAKHLCNQNNEATAISDDEDFLQFVNVGAKVFRPIKKEQFEYDSFKEQFGIIPEYFTLYKSLVGDNSDNINGVKRTGPVTAKKIINQLDQTNFENIIQNLVIWASQRKTSLQDKIIENIALIKRNFMLIDLSYIDLDENYIQEQFNLSIEKAQKINFNYIIKMFNLLKFKSFGKWLTKLIIEAQTKNPNLNVMELLKSIREGTI